MLHSYQIKFIIDDVKHTYTALLPDDLIIKKNCSKSMIVSHKKYKASVMASMMMILSGMMEIKKL